MQFDTNGSVHSFLFMGRTRTATVRLLISLWSFPFFSSSDVLDRVSNGRLGVSMETLEKQSGVVVVRDSIEARRLAISDFGVTGRLLCLEVGVEPQFRYRDVGVWQAFSCVMDFDLAAKIDLLALGFGIVASRLATCIDDERLEVFVGNFLALWRIAAGESLCVVVGSRDVPNLLAIFGVFRVDILKRVLAIYLQLVIQFNKHFWAKEAPFSQSLFSIYTK